MVIIRSKVWSQHTKTFGSRKLNTQVRTSTPKPITTFSELVEETAKVSYHNNTFFLFYRGQRKEHYSLGKRRNSTSIFPSIYRNNGAAVDASLIDKRFQNLDYATNVLLQILPGKGRHESNKLGKYDELAWSILQHYEVCQTPLLDITQSLLVAASFALNNSRPSEGDRTGILYVFGLPMITNGISYSIEDELLNVKLLSCCPPEAKRPFFQEGYLLSTHPSRVAIKHQHLDCAKRLIAKYKLVDSQVFWGRNFRKLSTKALYPNSEDEIYKSIGKRIAKFPYPEALPER